MRISIVVPCYNSQDSLMELVDRLQRTLKKSWYELILINDASPDNTWEVIELLSSKYQEVKGINLMKNFGQHAALLCGLNHVNGEFIVTIDDDLQNPPEEIIRMIEELEKNPLIDVVIGVPKEAKKSLVKKIGSNCLNRLTSIILDKPKDLKMSSFRVMRKRLVDEIKSNGTTNPAFGSLLLNYTRNIINLEVQHDERKYGASGYSLGKSIKLFLNNVLNYSTLPLRIVSNIGITASFIGLIMAIYYLFKYFMGHITVPGWTTLIVIVLFFSGLILFALGIIGEYLIRIISEVNHSRQFVIKQKKGF